MLAIYNRLCIELGIPERKQHLVYGYVRLHFDFLQNLNSCNNFPDDVKRICLLFYHSVAEHFLFDDDEIHCSLKKKKISIPRRPLPHLWSADYNCDSPLWTGHFNYNYNVNHNCNHIVRGNNTTSITVAKTYFWKFKVSPNFKHVRIGIIADVGVYRIGYPLDEWSYCDDGMKYHGNNKSEWGLKFGGDRWDIVCMELAFSTQKTSGGGTLSFSRGIQKLKVAFDDLERNRNYKMYCTMESQLHRDEACLELLEYNEYFARDQSKVSPWRKICGSCQRSKVTLRCSACKKVYYCNRTCQKSHWKYEHKEKCKILCGDTTGKE